MGEVNIIPRKAAGGNTGGAGSALIAYMRNKIKTEYFIPTAPVHLNNFKFLQFRYLLRAVRAATAAPNCFAFLFQSFDKTPKECY